MSQLIESLKNLEVKAQLVELADYLVDAKEDGAWHEAHAIESRISELETEHPTISDELKEESKRAKEASEAKKKERYLDSFAARNID